MGRTKRRQPDETRAATDDRAREDDSVQVLELTTDEPTFPIVAFGSGVTVVVGINAEAADRLAAHVADALSGRLLELDGRVLHGERTIDLRDAPPLDGQLPVVIAGEDVDTHRQERVDQQLAEIERRRADFEERRLEVVAQREALTAAVEELGAAQQDLDVRARAARVEIETQTARRAIARSLTRFRSARRLPAVPPEAATAVATTWSQLTEACGGIADGGLIDLASSEAAVDAARDALAAIDAELDGVTPEAVDEIQQAHLVVESAEQQVEVAKRRQRGPAEAARDTAIRAANAVLARHGYPTRAAFIVALAEGGPDKNQEQERVHGARALEEALHDLAVRQELAAITDGRAVEDVEAELRVTAGELLGHEPGDDLAAQLLALVEEPGELLEARRDLRQAVGEQAIDLDVSSDEELEGAVARWLAEIEAVGADDLSDAHVTVATLEAELASLTERLGSRQLRLAGMERDDESLRAGLDELDATEARVRQRGTEHLDVSEIVAAMSRADAGRPIVLSGMFRDMLSSEVALTLDDLLESASDGQRIVISELDSVTQWASEHTPEVHVWSCERAHERVQQRQREAEAAIQLALARDQERARQRTDAGRRQAEEERLDAEEQARRDTERQARAADAQQARDARELEHRAEMHADAERLTAEREARDTRREAEKQAETERKRIEREQRDAEKQAAADQRERERSEHEAEAARRRDIESRAREAAKAGESERKASAKQAKQAERDRRKAGKAAAKKAKASGATGREARRVQATEGLADRQRRRKEERRRRLERFGPFETTGEVSAADLPAGPPSNYGTSSPGQVPWARFDEEIARRRRARGGDESVAKQRIDRCARHRTVAADLLCDRCHQTFCEQCLVPVRNEIVCIDCALVAAGARAKRR